MTRGELGWIGRVIDGVWLVLLAIYALAGYRNVPFHGDESTLIAMSRDYHHLFVAGDLDAVLYSDSPADPAAQDLRILNGTTSKLAMGLAWDLAGLSVVDLNQQWAWGAPWEWNLSDRHMPGDRLLYAARLSSALMLAASAWAVFAIGWIAGGGRVAGMAASAVYVLTPAVLLNGRRAMMEGAMLLGVTLTVWAGLLLLRARESGRVRWGHYALLGLAAGFALSSKHNTLLAVGIVFAVCAPSATPARLPIRLGRYRTAPRDEPERTDLAAWTVTRSGARYERVWRETPRLLGWGDIGPRAHLVRLFGAGLLALAVFLLLNPAWWSDPLPMPGRVWDARQNLIDLQKQAYGAYDGPGQQVAGLIRRTANGEPQYYEVAQWREWIGANIRAYEAHVWTGIDGGLIGAWLRLVGLVIGTAALLHRAIGRDSDRAAGLALAWFWITALALLLLTPFDWQRYYLPLQPALAVVIGAAVARAVEVVRAYLLFEPDESFAVNGRGR